MLEGSEPIVQNGGSSVPENSSETASTDVIYMDNNATTRPAPLVVQEVCRVMHQLWANPSSGHRLGREAQAAVKEARREVALSLSAQPEQIVFVSGGTEACNMAIYGALQMYIDSGRTGVPHVIASTVEHAAVAHTLSVLQKRNKCSVSWVCSAGLGGGVSVSDVKAHITADTCLIAIMLANNETGVVNNLSAITSELDSLANRRQFWVYSDAAQAFGKIPVNVQSLGVDLLSIVGHKFHGPRFAAMYVSPRCEGGRSPGGASGGSCLSLLIGGGQERGLRAGTENTAMICGLAVACRLVTLHLTEYTSQMDAARLALERALSRSGVAERFNIWPQCARLPNTCSAVLATERATAHCVLRHCCHLAASTSAACHSDQSCQVNGVLVCSGVEKRDAVRTVRLSVCHSTSDEEVAATVADLKQAMARAEQEALDNGEQLLS